MWRKVGLKWGPPPLPAVWGRVSTPLQVALLSSPLDYLEHNRGGGVDEHVTVRFMDGRTITTHNPLEVRVVAYFAEMQSNAMEAWDDF